MKGAIRMDRQFFQHLVLSHPLENNAGSIYSFPFCPACWSSVNHLGAWTDVP
ncbi:hypothetical protein COCNU_scaffold008269G000020 [Cocos nucifera]|nr:hypothetical protein [Cocos nucifera]